jgi:hypothetical protein
MSRIRKAERGEGNLGCILWTVVLGLAIFIGWKVIPVKIASAQLYDFMKEQAKFAGDVPADQIANKILWRAQELRLPLDKEHVTVKRIGDTIKMEAIYTVPIEFPGKTYNMHFDHQVDLPIYIF